MGQLIPPVLPLGGGCPCEAVRFLVSAMPLLVYACHCADCQRASGTAFAMMMPMAAEGFAITRGEPKCWRRTGSSGAAVTRWFCGDCGGCVHERHDMREELVVVSAGTLDDTSWLRPIAHVHLKSAQAWQRIPNQAECFDLMPREISLLSERWRAMWRQP
jgi:hypothetical protein